MCPDLFFEMLVKTPILISEHVVVAEELGPDLLADLIGDLIVNVVVAV